MYSSPYHAPLIEESSPLHRDHVIHESDRPGTPALGECGDLIIDGAPQLQYGNPSDDVHRYADGSRYQQRYNHHLDRAFPGVIPRDPNLVYPSTAAPPTSPSQLYAFLLQRNIRSSECPVIETRPQAYGTNPVEWNPPHIYQNKAIHQNDHRRDIRERERLLYRHYSNIRHRYEQYGERRPFLNQNYTRLPYNMVRIKNTNDDKEVNGVNGYAEDDEGNHECHDIRHESLNSENPIASAEGHHHNGTSQIGAAEVPGASDMSSLGAIYQGEWPMHRALWMSGPSCIGEKDPLDGFGGDDTESIMSFSSSTATMSSRRPHTHQLGTKVEMVYSLLSMLGSCNKEDMSRTLLEMSSNQDSCIAMRQSGCLPLLIQLLHGSERDQVTSDQRSSENVKWAVREARQRASQALHNIVHAHPDDRRGRREARVLRLLEQIRDYSDFLRDLDSSNVDFSHNENLDLHPGPAIAALMKLSFDEEHRHAMCQLGGLQAIAELIQADHEVHGNTSDQFCVTVRRYAGMALTNLTFGDGTNKALLCSMKPFMQALVAQLHSPNEDLRQVTASVLRNLSWRADASSKQILREVGVVTTLMKAAMEANKESTLKSILSALWNLSAHCSMNKADICEIDGALEFLVSTLTYKSASNTLSIIENGGGILRNISSHIAVREDYRQILRKQKCLQTLLCHLKSPSLTIVSNACGTLWNLSARCAEDQQALWEMGAVGMLRNLVHSKHKMISMGSSAALKNLLAARPEGIGIGLGPHTENGHHLNGGTTNMPSLLVRKQKALAAEIDENLSETCDNIDSPKTSPTPCSDFAKKFMYENTGINCLDRRPQFLSYLPGRMYHSINGHVGSPIRVPRSESKDSLGSTRSEPPHYKAQRERFKIYINNNRGMMLDSKTVQEKPTEWKERTNLPFEGNSNVVLQLFRHLQNGTSSNTVLDAANQIKKISNHDNKPAVRPTTLPQPKRGVWNVRNTKYAGQNSSHNGLPLLQNENGFANSETNGHAYEINQIDNLKPSETCNGVQINNLREIPGNRRIFTSRHDSETSSDAGRSTLSYSGSTLYGNIPDSKEQEEKAKVNVVLRKKKTNDTLSSSAVMLNRETVTDESGVDQTPLMISRCSSLSSLTSCFQHSARSSWVSDVSQRTSAVISPTDLPDSPSCGISEEKPCISEFTDKIPDADAHGLIRPRPAWPMSSQPSSDSLPSSVKRMSLESDVFVGNDISHFSSTADHSENSEIMVSPDSSKTPPARPQNTPVSPEKELCSSGESLTSQENNEDPNQDGMKDHEMPSTCVSLISIPNNASEAHHNNSILHSKVNNLCSSFSLSRSGIPIKSSCQTRLIQSFPNSARPDVTSIVGTTPLNSLSKLFNQSKLVNLHGKNYISNSTEAICDDNDNLLFSSGNIETVQMKQQNFQSCDSKSEHSVKPKLNIPSENTNSRTNTSQAFESKCLSVCKKYPALSHKSGFGQSEHRQADAFADQISSGSRSSAEEHDGFSKMSTSNNSLSSKTKTAIPQIIRAEKPVCDGEQHPRQLHIKSQNLPVYVGTTTISSKQQSEQSSTPQENTSSAEENISEDILSTSPSACDESEDIDTDKQTRLPCGKSGEPPIRRIKSKKSKANRRSMEIRPPSEQSSEDDNKNSFNRISDSNSISVGYHISVPSSESEGKVKEDQRTREKVSRGIIPDLLEGAAFHDELSNSHRSQNNAERSNIPKVMTDSMELRRGALMIAAELEEGIDDCTHSSTSFDLENMKPPSCMGEMSMTSSGLSDLLSNGNGCYINGKRAIDRRRNMKKSKKLGGNHRFVLKSVRQTLVSNLDVSKQLDKIDKPISASTSFENISMRSSGTSDLIDNINPPSILDDISMTNSCASLNSISSDILESRSQSLADPRSNSEMFQRLNAAAAMVQVYSRELSNIMTGSMKSSCNSDCLDLVKPPSIFQDIAEVTVEDGTEVASDPLVSDFEFEEELPHDDEASVPSTETVHSPFLQTTKNTDGSIENLNSSVDGDSLMDREHFSVKRISSLALEPQNTRVIDISHNSIQHPSSTTIGNEESSCMLNFDADDSCDVDERMDECITSTPSPAVRRGPRIVKPINRETVRQMQEKKNAEKSVKAIRGRATSSKPKNLLQQVTSAHIAGSNIKIAGTKTSSPSVSGVRPTRTSALRASQNKQPNIRGTSGRMSPRSFLSKPPTTNLRNSNRVNKTVIVNSNNHAPVDSKTNSSQSETKRPHPPVKQGTFTKEETNPKVPNLLSPASDMDLPSENVVQYSDDQNNNEKLYGIVTSVTSGSTLLDRKISFASASAASSSNRNLQRKLSAPVQRKSGERTGIPQSPSSQSLPQEDRSSKKITEKKSPTSGSSIGRGSSVVGSRTTSTNSLSSVSSNSLSVKKSSSQKDVPSKISSIWKRSESSSSANSPVTDNSSVEKSTPSNFRNKILTSKSATLRSNSVTLPSTTQNSIPRSSTYEKLSRTNGHLNENVKSQSKVASNLIESSKPKQSKPTSTITKTYTKQKASSTTTKPSGGARIVKPVTPRPKPSAITSKTLRQSGSFTPYSESRSYSLSSGPPACLSIGRSSSNSDSRVSIPLVTAPFAYTTLAICDESKLNESKVESNSTENGQHLKTIVDGNTSSAMNGNRKDSESEDSDKEGV
ncbi:uncharacterized protein LOC118192660 isoform X2 [Stegodyphus dumicola]|nr:uncharacterized protein LOC118192660 isoform X2 [Stegodyphus dumicola]